MNWSFNFAWFFAGLVILIAGATITINYQKIADNFASGISSYQKIKLIGIIVAGVGLLVMSNLHTLLLTGLVNIIFKR